MPVNFVRVCSAIIILIVVLAGGVVTVLHPETLSFKEYIQDVAIGTGLLGVGYGIDSGSKP